MAKKEPPSRAKWVRWLERLRNEVWALHLYRATWQSIVNAIDDNPKIPRTHVFNFMSDTYAASQAMAIRRLCGDQAEEINFRNLLHEVEEHPDLVVPAYRDEAQVEADLKALNSGNLKKVQKYASQYLAHGPEQRPAPVPTFSDLHAAIDDLGTILRRYSLMIEEADLVLEPPILGDWMAPFRMAWLPPLPSSKDLSG
jgi:hypothetical protein